MVGASAGGYLALFLGVTNGDDAFEGTVGGTLDESSRVDAVVDYYGPSDFLLRLKTQPEKTEKKGSPVRLLLGKTVEGDPDLAKRASPAHLVSKGAAPLLILHGDGDKVVLPGQSERMAEAYRTEGLDVTLEIIPGAKHGGKPFFTQKYRDQVAAFLGRHLKN